MTILQIAVLFFVSVLLLVVTAYMWYVAVTTSPKRELKKRMRRLAVDGGDRKIPSELRVEILKEMGFLDRLLYKIPPVRRLDALIDKADFRAGGVKVDVKTFLLFVLACAASAFAAGLLLKRGMVVPLAFMPLGGAVPLLYLVYKKSKRLSRFTEQFPDALGMIARSLRAGHSLTSAVRLVGAEMPEPIAGLFKTAYEEQTLGVSTRDAVTHIADRIDSTDIRFFVMAVNIHKEIGGNLGEILEKLARTIRERLTIRRQVRVYTAQAKLSGYILAVVPVFMAMVFYFASPGYIEELFAADIGRYAIVLAVAGQIAGFLVIKRIVNIRI
jgi:tight adherence protein B